MRNVALMALRILLLCGFLWACVGGFHLIVLYDEPVGLKPDAHVVWQGRTIGRVQSIASGDADRVAVQLQIKKDYRDKVTEKSRFIIQDVLPRENASYVEMVNLAEEGNPLPEGSHVEGSTYLSLLMERTEQGVEEWSELLEQELQRWEEDLRQLPVKEWYKELEREMDYWLKELGRTGAETRQYFMEEILPQLEEKLEELKKRLRQLGKDKEVKVLQIKLEELKSM